MNECSYNLGKCKDKVEYWIKKRYSSFWYPLCKIHLDQIVVEDVEIEQLQIEKERKRKYKDHKINWKMFLDWEELSYHPKIHTLDKAYGDIELTIALNEHRKNKLQKYIKRVIKCGNKKLNQE